MSDTSLTKASSVAEVLAKHDRIETPAQGIELISAMLADTLAGSVSPKTSGSVTSALRQWGFQPTRSRAKVDAAIAKLRAELGLSTTSN